MEPGALGRRRRRGGAFSIARLFANGEAGGVYDPSDLTAEKVAWRRNLLTWSEDFTNAAWTKTRSSITPNAGTSWDGTATASKLVEDTSTNTHYVQQQATSSVASQTISIYAKAAERSLIGVYEAAIGAGTVFDLANGTVSSSRPSGWSVPAASAIEAIGSSGWYRLTVTISFQAVATRSFRFFTLIAANSDSYTGDGTSGVLIDSAQFEQSPTATAYQRITDFTSDFLAAFPTHGLYQDAAGTTPVTALGQPVGLVIDSKTGGLANLGPELVTNGDFSGGTTGWTAGTGSTIQVLNGQMRATNSTGSDGAYFGQQMSFVAGRTYRLSADVVSDGTSLASRVQLGTALGTNNRLSYAAGFGTRTVFYMPTATETLWLWFYPAYQVVPNYIVLDNISVREVPGVHAIQATNSSRPLLDGRVNLFVSSDEVGTGAGWTIASGTVTANAAVAPDGTTTADAYTPSAVSASQQIAQVGTGVASSYIQSIAAKANGYSFIQMNNAGNTDFVNFDLSTGTVGTVSGVTASIEPLGNGWYRCTTVYAPLTPNINFRFQVVPSASATRAQAFTGNGTSGVLFWRADFRLAADAAYPPQRVTTATDYADVGVPRSFAFDGFDDSLYTASNMDFATVTSDGLARRNLLTNPTQFDDASWLAIGTKNVTANTTVAPDGTLTADTVTDSSAVAYQGITQTTTISSTSPYTLSLYVLKTTGGTSATFGVNWALSGGTGIGYNFRLNTDTGAVNGGWTAVSDGAYWRLTATASNAGGNNTSVYNIYPAAATHGSLSSDSSAATGSAVIWGAQLEAGTTATAFQNIGTDKVTVLAGVRKLSDAAAGMLAETSADVSANNGTFYLLWPRSGSLNGVQSASKGTVASVANSGNTYAAPATRVLAVLADISGDALNNRINGVVDGTSATDQGTGNYGSYVLFIGRRNNASLPFNGKAYQLIVRGALTDAATLAQAERYVGAKTGIFL